MASLSNLTQPQLDNLAKQCLAGGPTDRVQVIAGELMALLLEVQNRRDAEKPAENAPAAPETKTVPAPNY